MLLLIQGRAGAATVDHDLALKDLCLLPPTPLAWSPAGELLYASSGDAAPNRQQLKLAGPWADAHARRPHAADGEGGPRRCSARARPLRRGAAEEGADAAAAAGATARGGDGTWAVDVSHSMRARAARGYALDATANLEVLGSTRAAASSAAEQLHLVAAWGWLASRDAPALARPAPPPPSSRMSPPAAAARRVATAPLPPRAGAACDAAAANAATVARGLGQRRRLHGRRRSGGAAGGDGAPLTTCRGRVAAARLGAE